MDRRLLTAAVGGVALVAAVAAIFTTQMEGPPFIAGDQPVTADQVLKRMQSNGYADVQVARQGNYFEGTGSKNGKTAKLVVDARTGRLVDRDDDSDK